MFFPQQKKNIYTALMLYNLINEARSFSSTFFVIIEVFVVSGVRYIEKFTVSTVVYNLAGGPICCSRAEVDDVMFGAGQN